MEIDLAVLTDGGKLHNLSGKERGEQARRHFDIEGLDTKPDEVIVKIPRHVYALSASFFLGLFSPTVVRMGEQKFLQKYRFDASPVVMQQVQQGLLRCLSDRGQLH